MKDNIHSLPRRTLYALVCGIVCIVSLFIGEVQFLVEKGEVAVKDNFAAMDGSVEPRQDFVFLGIDDYSMLLDTVDESFQSYQYKEAYQLIKRRQPWSRKAYGLTIERLLDAGAKLVIVDLLLVAPADPEGDGYLTGVIEKYPGKIVLAGKIGPIAGQGSQVILSEPELAFLGPLENETPYGYVNFWGAADGLIRNARVWTSSSLEQEAPSPPRLGEQKWESLSLVAARQLGYKEENCSENRERRMKLPRPAAGEGGSSLYPPISWISIFDERVWEVSYKNGNYFKDKVVMFGPESAQLKDKHMMTIGQVNGPQMHLHSLACLLDGSWLHDVDLFSPLHKWWLGWCLVASALFSLVVVALSERVSVLLVMMGSGVLVWVIACYCSYQYGYLVAFTPALYVLAGMFAGAAYCLVIEEVARRKSLQTQLGRSMSPAVAAAVVRAPQGYYEAAKGRRLPVAILFSDIRGFTELSEGAKVEELVLQLNDYFEEMVGATFKHEGTVDKFIGDAIMATWGALGSTSAEECAIGAVNTAVEMFERLDKLNDAAKAIGREPIEIGIGVHTGEVVVGEIGSRQRADFTVMGDAVNLTSRIEGLTSKLGLKFLCSSEVVELHSAQDQLIYVGAFRVKGKTQAIELYTFKTGLEWLGALEPGLRGRGEIVEKLETLDALNKNHRLAQFYLHNVKEKGEFEGVFILDSK